MPPERQRVLAALTAALPPDMEVIVTSNRVRMVSVAGKAGRRRVRVAARLLDLGERAVPAVADFAVGQRGSRTRLQALLGELPVAPPTRRRTVTLRPQGDVHDLATLMRSELAAAPDLDPAGVPITWGARCRLRRNQRTVRLGAYAFETKVIRLHPLLDDELTPAWFVGFVVFHELLHHHYGVQMAGTRRILHPAALRSREALHARFDDAREWERDQLPILMRRGRLGWAPQGVSGSRRGGRA